MFRKQKKKKNGKNSVNDTLNQLQTAHASWMDILFSLGWS